MTNKLLFKEFNGTVQYSTKDSYFYGRIEGINDLVTFEGETVSDLKASFEEALEDYIALCPEIDKEPLKSFKGSFNVRITPKLHSKAFKFAALNGTSLNQLVSEAIQEKIASL